MLRPAASGDAADILDLFDEAVAWLVSQGITAQWGTRPFSARPEMRRQIVEWIDRGVMYVAELYGEMVGTIVVNDRTPGYAVAVCQGLPGPALYLEALVTSRRHAGEGIGAAFLSWAEQHAIGAGVAHLRLDCWADNRALVAYYERAGFVGCGTFGSDRWRGQLFQKALAGELEVPPDARQEFSLCSSPPASAPEAAQLTAWSVESSRPE